MKWNEVKVETASEAVEAVANCLMEAGASGVAIEDALDVANFQSDPYGEILDPATYTSLEEGALVKAYFPETTFYRRFCPLSRKPSVNSQIMGWLLVKIR